MSDVEVLSSGSEIVRRQVDRESAERALAVIDPAVLDTLFASRDPRVIVERIAEVSTVLMEAVRQRDLARRYGDNKSEFLHIEAWQLLSTELGMSTVGVREERIENPDGWMAWAELRHVATGRTLGARPGICDRSEPGKQRAPQNTILQMAHVRAARAAARSVLGFVPKIGGFEITDPEAPATNEQVGMLHQLERAMGVSHDEAHAMAGVASFKDLNREGASTLIDRWQAIVDEIQGGGAGTPPPSSNAGDASPRPGTSGASSTSLSGVGTEESPEPSRQRAYGEGESGSKGAGDSSPASDEAWSRAPKDMTLSGAVKLAGKLRQENRITGNVPKRKAEFTGEQLAKVSAAWRDGERG